MGEGLQRALAESISTQVVDCPVCGKLVKLRVSATKVRVPLHGPSDARCSGSGEWTERQV